MKQLWMDWQLFAEGESAPEVAGEGQDSTPPDAGEDFEALIRGRCKEEFDARVKKILDGRLRGCGRRTSGCGRRRARGGAGA